jgi:CTP:molybdopterin cytidylyltransferase MocA
VAVDNEGINIDIDTVEDYRKVLRKHEEEH